MTWWLTEETDDLSFFFLVHSDSVALGEGFILPPVFSISLDRQIDNHWMKVKLLKSVSHSVLTRHFATPWTSSPLGSSVHGFLQTRILEGAISFSRGFS